MRSASYGSWGRLNVPVQHVLRPRHRDEALPRCVDPRGWLAYGNGRSYGDSCLNDGGLLIDTRGLDRFIAFDADTGVLECEAGILLSDILDVFVPRGWFLPVTPGTQYVTLGGAIANDVHGKNHHGAGTFGCHVERLQLLRSRDARLSCAASENSELFGATIGGLGLTGLIETAAIRLRRIPSPMVDVETVRFAALDEFFDLVAQSDGRFEYTVAWVDAMAPAKHQGRGLFMRGNHAAAGDAASARRSGALAFPFDAPIVPNPLTLRALNALYYHHQRQRRVSALQHYCKFFYPLDALRDWNRIYGKRGFFQFQCVVPNTGARESIRALLDALRASGHGSALAVLKRFGDARSPGMMSFPRPGVTLAVDVPNAGEATLSLLMRLESITMDVGGALYPAKDARMSPAAFRRSFPALATFQQYVDPDCSSSFWRRVTEC